MFFTARLWNYNQTGFPQGQALPPFGEGVYSEFEIICRIFVSRLNLGILSVLHLFDESSLFRLWQVDWMIVNKGNIRRSAGVSFNTTRLQSTHFSFPVQCFPMSLVSAMYRYFKLKRFLCRCCMSWSCSWTIWWGQNLLCAKWGSLRYAVTYLVLPTSCIHKLSDAFQISQSHAPQTVHALERIELDGQLVCSHIPRHTSNLCLICV